MHDAERVGLRHPAVIVDRARPVAAVVVEFVDRDDLARLRFGNQVVVVEAPPGRRIAAEGAAGKGGIAAGARLHIEDPHLEHIARLGAVDINRAGANMHAEPFAGTAPMDRCVERPGAAPVDILRVLRPVEDALRAGVARDHAGMVVIGVMRQCLDRDEIT